MALAQELAETNALLRASISGKRTCRTGVCHPEADCSCDVPDVGASLPVPVGRIAPLVAMMALREHLKVVPEEYWRRHRNSATIGCVCRRAHRMRPGFQECGCGRTFAFTGRRLYVLPAE